VWQSFVSGRHPKTFTEAVLENISSIQELPKCRAEFIERERLAVRRFIPRQSPGMTRPIIARAEAAGLLRLHPSITLVIAGASGFLTLIQSGDGKVDSAKAIAKASCVFDLASEQIATLALVLDDGPLATPTT
jgi:hypothetical protein